jgi:secondary thiamine-phosphate synthase enzyme
MSSFSEITIRSSRRNQLVDITDEVQEIISAAGVESGIAHIFVPHTTAAITINENADPTVQSDMLGFLEKLVPENAGFRHSEGNSDAHVKSSLVGAHIATIFNNGRLVFGTWQGIYFCEFDGPRSRRVIVKIVPDK